MKHQILTTDNYSLSFDGKPPDVLVGGMLVAVSGFVDAVDTWGGFMMRAGDDDIDMLRSEGLTIVGVLSISVGDEDTSGIVSGSRIEKYTIIIIIILQQLSFSMV